MCNKLKPCPFCGNKPYWGCDGERPDFTYHVSCECQACVEDFDTKESAIKAWNTRPEDKIEVERDDEFWKEIIYKDGKIDEEQVLKELADFGFVMTELSKVYCHITGGLLSKPMYYAEGVISKADEYYDALYSREGDNE